MFVTFKDIKDPKTVINLQEVSGCWEKDENGTCIKEGFHITADRFEEILGKGVKLRSSSIEMTDEPVIWGIDKYLPWLAPLKGGYLDGQFANVSRDLSNILHGGKFKTEIK